jgi:hypothetical protein
MIHRCNVDELLNVTILFAVTMPGFMPVTLDKTRWKIQYSTKIVETKSKQDAEKLASEYMNQGYKIKGNVTKSSRVYLLTVRQERIKTNSTEGVL